MATNGAINVSDIIHVPIVPEEQKARAEHFKINKKKANIPLFPDFSSFRFTLTDKSNYPLAQNRKTSRHVHSSEDEI